MLDEYNIEDEREWNSYAKSGRNRRSGCIPVAGIKGEVLHCQSRGRWQARPARLTEAAVCQRQADRAPPIGVILGLVPRMTS